MRNIRSKLTYSNVMVTLLAFIVLGGGAYAASRLPKNSVGAGQIKTNAVRAAEIANNAVGSGEVKNGSLKCGDLEAQACAAGLSNITVRSHTATVPLQCQEIGTLICFAPAEIEVSAQCEFGERALGGGYEGSSHQEGNTGSTSLAAGSGDHPEPRTGTPTGWTVKATGSGTGNSGGPNPSDPAFTTYVLCAS